MRALLFSPEIEYLVERLREWSRVILVTIWNRFKMGGPKAPWIGGTISNRKQALQHASFVPDLCEVLKLTSGNLI